MIARGRLADARRWFVILGWDQLPQSQRGRNILRWGADHAWLANPAHPKRSVRNWCSCWDRTLTDHELDQIVADTATSNKRWTADQSATILGIGVRNREAHSLWFNGADDDPNYDIRREAQRAKDAAKKRRRRAARSTGAKRGRPALQLSPEEALARRRAKTAERVRRCRKKTVTLKCVPPLSKEDIGRGTQLSVTDVIEVPAVATPALLPAVITAPLVDSGSPQATPRPAPLDDDVQELVKIEKRRSDVGVGFGPPPPLSHLERVFREFGRRII